MFVKVTQVLGTKSGPVWVNSLLVKMVYRNEEAKRTEIVFSDETQISVVELPEQCFRDMR